MQALPKTSIRFGELSPQTGGRDECRGGLLLSASPLCASTGEIDSRVVFNHDTASSTHFGADRDLRFSGQRTRAVVTPQTRAGYFRRRCGGVFKRGQQCSSRNMPPNISITPLAQVTLNYPLVSADVASAALKCDRTRVMALIDEGKIRWAFNFALELSYRCEPRILSVSLADYQSGRVTQWPQDMDEFSAVIKLIFPMAPQVRAGVVATLRATTVAKQMGISINHFLKLCDANWIKLAKGTRRCAGPAGSPLVEFASVVEFLKRRRIA